MGRREETIRRKQQRVSDLIQGFDAYCDFFDGASLFTGQASTFISKPSSSCGLTVQSLTQSEMRRFWNHCMPR